MKQSFLRYNGSLWPFWRGPHDPEAGCLCEAVAILVTTLTCPLLSGFDFPFPSTPASPVTGKLCLRALFSREAGDDNATMLL